MKKLIFSLLILSLVQNVFADDEDILRETLVCFTYTIDLEEEAQTRVVCGENILDSTYASDDTYISLSLAANDLAKAGFTPINCVWDWTINCIYHKPSMSEDTNEDTNTESETTEPETSQF